MSAMTVELSRKNQNMAFYVGPWLIEPDKKIVSKDDENISIETRLMEVLCYLYQHKNQIVSIEQLIDRVWQGRVVGNHAIYRAINQLRKILRQEQLGYEWIETVPRKGYQLNISPEDSSGRLSLLSGFDATHTNQLINQAQNRLKDDAFSCGVSNIESVDSDNTESEELKQESSEQAINVAQSKKKYRYLIGLIGVACFVGGVLIGHLLEFSSKYLGVNESLKDSAVEQVSFSHSLKSDSSSVAVPSEKTYAFQMLNIKKFDGVKDLMKISNLDVLNVGESDFAIEVWVKTQEEFGVILDKRAMDFPVTGYELMIYDGRVLLQLGSQSSGWSNYFDPESLKVSDNQWHHLVANVSRKDESPDVHLYVDGKLVLKSKRYKVSGSLDTEADLLIGAHQNGGYNYKGHIQQITIYKRFLTEQEIRKNLREQATYKCKRCQLLK
ncbi:LamG-like jellyroll fold domain-containing protein [Aliikangiella coralliicola]|uniref:OmpR/PhoB-type domain-containing protein n=1 Tax=Aliikangiella coralliicola TaxID=2592383 RepID=A0A545U7U3_9GAMM|nr:LamG-like jellyroll fold domain-containing protein [Aliikangiella coralliicola]TQV85535.1 hypothetical protein FLL46_20470 [Aliikangiella coralliicola]